MENEEIKSRIKDRNFTGTVTFLIIIIIILGGIFAYKALNRDSSFISIGSENSTSKETNKNDLYTVTNDKANDYRVSRINEAISIVKAELYSDYYSGKDVNFADYADGTLIAQRLYKDLADADFVNSVDDIKVEAVQSSSETTFTISFPNANNLDLSNVKTMVIDFWTE